MATAEFRFYEELNDFLPPERRKRAFAYACAERATVKNAIEALGVPHTEVEIILVNGRSVDFTYLMKDGDRVAVYPQFESIDVTPLLRVREKPLRQPHFVADAHLGGLAKYLRLLGFDTLYRNDIHDGEVARIAASERRIVLTRDRVLLMHRAITHGCYVRAMKPLRQLEEVLTRLDLFRAIQPFTRCLCCNRPLEAIDKAALAERLPPDTLSYYAEFRTCRDCDRIYWPGSHYRRLQQVIDRALQQAKQGKPGLGVAGAVC
jgi:uncharacterized protein with PIN domain